MVLEPPSPRAWRISILSATFDSVVTTALIGREQGGLAAPLWTVTRAKVQPGPRRCLAAAGLTQRPVPYASGALHPHASQGATHLQPSNRLWLVGRTAMIMQQQLSERGLALPKVAPEAKHRHAGGQRGRLDGSTESDASEQKQCHYYHSHHSHHAGLLKLSIKQVNCDGASWKLRLILSFLLIVWMGKIVKQSQEFTKRFKRLLFFNYIYIYICHSQYFLNCTSSPNETRVHIYCVVLCLQSNGQDIFH
jgi:hypothetical protein